MSKKPKLAPHPLGNTQVPNIPLPSREAIDAFTTHEEDLDDILPHQEQYRE